MYTLLVTHVAPEATQGSLHASKKKKKVYTQETHPVLEAPGEGHLKSKGHQQPHEMVSGLPKKIKIEESEWICSTFKL